MSVIIHVGPPKTGTTTFQSELWRRSNKKSLNAYYPTGLDINKLAAECVQKNIIAIERLSALYNDFLNSSHKNLVLSAENFSNFGNIDVNSYEKSLSFFNSIRDIFSKEEVILLYTLTSDPYKRMESTVIEAIKHGKSFHMESICEYIKKIPYFSVEKLFKNVVRIVQPTKIQVVILEKNTDIFTKTSHLFELTFSPLECIPVRNFSPSCNLSFLLHQINTRKIPFYLASSQKVLRQYNVEAISRFKKLNDIETNDKSFFDFLRINSRDELFTLIDPKFTDQKNELKNYISKFQVDLDNYIIGTSNLSCW